MSSSTCRAADQEFERLLAAARQGDNGAMGQLLEQHREQLLALASHRLPSQLHAKLNASDVVQQTFLDVHRQFHTFNGRSKSSLIAWLKASVLNHLRDEIRRFRSKRRQSTREIPIDRGSNASHPLLDPLTPSQDAVAREQNQQLNEAIDRLSERSRQLIWMRHRDNLSFVEMGRRLGLSENAARKQWIRAVTQLQLALESRKETGERRRI